MSNIVIVNSQLHKSLRVFTQASARHGDDQRFVAVVVNEFSALACLYPLLLSKDSETGAFFCGAMLGFDAGENLFLAEHRSRRIYRPLNLQRGPFFTAGSDLAIDLEHVRVSPSGDQALFESSGEYTPYLKSITQLMQELRPGLERTRLFIETLLSLNLIEAIDIKVSFDDGSRRELSGLYTVNREALSSLPDESVVSLFRRGYLQLIYYMLTSLSNVSSLVVKKNQSFLPSAGPVGQ